MKGKFWILFLFSVVAAFCQPSGPVRFVAVDPSGSCQANQLQYNTTNGNLWGCENSVWTAVSGTGSGTVTTFSAGNFVPLFTTTVTNASTTPALSFTASNAAPRTAFMGPTSGGGAPGIFRVITSGDLPTSGLTGIAYYTAGTAAAITGTSTDCVHVDGTSSVCPSGGGPAGSTNDIQTNAGGGVFGTSGCSGASGTITCAGVGTGVVKPVASSGTNAAGVDIDFAGGQGTGTGVGGTIHFQYAPAGSSGTSVNPLTDAATINGSTGQFNITNLNVTTCTGCGGSVTISPYYYYIFGQPGYNANETMAMAGSGAHGGERFVVVLQAPLTMNYLYLRISGAVSSTFGSVAIYNNAMNTKLCETTPFSTATAGFFMATWSSPCTLTPPSSGTNSFWLVTTSDSASVTLSSYYDGGWNIESNYSGYLGLGSSISTGTGSPGLAFNADLSSVTWTNNSNVRPPIVAGGVVSF